MQVRPDDLDLFGHVHSSKYIDYVLAARFDQMERCYGMSMKEFIENGYAWFLVNTNITYKRGLGLGEHFEVETQIDYFDKFFVGINFDILNMHGKSCAAGTAKFALFNMEKKRSEAIPDWVLQRYSEEAKRI